MKNPDSLEHVGSEIDKLIEAGWDVLENNFDPVSFQGWRKRVARIKALLNDGAMCNGCDW